MKKNLVANLVIGFSITLFAAVPATWSPRGVGGGGALFCPSINPANDNEYYIGCDMSELFHTTDFGATYTLEPFTKIQGGHNSSVRFTNNPKIRYCISYANDIILPVRSVDGGASWTALAGNPDESEETYSIFADYNNPDRVIIAYYGALYFSANGGTSFTQIHTAQNSGSGIVLGGVFFDGNTIYLGTNDGLLVSTNGGTAFTVANVSGMPAGEAIFSFAGAKEGTTTRFFCVTGAKDNLYAGLVGSDYDGFLKGVYSLDYGSGSWTARMSGIKVGTDNLMFVAMAENNVSTVYLAGNNGATGAPDVVKTTNAGAAWTEVFNDVNNQNIASGWSGEGGDRGWGYGEAAFGLAVAPNNADKALISDFGFVHKTSDGGTTWQQAYVAAADQHPAGAATPTRRYYHSIGIENTSCWQIVWVDSATMFACYTDIKGMRSTDAGTTWGFDYAGHNGNTMYWLTKGASGTLYAGTSNIHDMYQSTRLADAQLDANDAEGKVLSSVNKGAAWTTVHAFNHPVFWVTLDPNNQNTMYASVVHSTQGGIFVTKNLQEGAASTWTKLPNPPRTEGHPASIVVLNDGSVVCTYSGRRATAFTASSGVFIYTPSTGSWADVSDAGMKYWTKDIVVDPHDAAQNTWYVGVFCGWGGAPNGLGGLYKTTNRGTSWTRIKDLDRVTSLTINPESGSEAYLTTETEGLWHTTNLTDAAPIFTQVDSYPFRQPERVFFNPYNKNELWVSSFGNGMRVGLITPAALSHTQSNHAVPLALVARYVNNRIVFTAMALSRRVADVKIVAPSGACLLHMKMDSRQLLSTGIDAKTLSTGSYIVSVDGIGWARIVVVR